MEPNRDLTCEALPRPRPASHAVRTVVLRLPRAGAQGDSKQDRHNSGPSQWGKGLERWRDQEEPAQEDSAPHRPTKRSLTRETAPRRLPPPSPCPTGPIHARHLPSQALRSQPKQEPGTWDTASSRRPGPASPLLPPAPRRLGTWVPNPGKAGLRGDRSPGSPTHPPYRGPPRPRRLRGPRSRPGSVRERPGPGSHLTASGPPRGAACGPGQTPTAQAAESGAAAPVRIPVPAFPAPQAPPAEPRLRDIAQAQN